MASVVAEVMLTALVLVLMIGNRGWRWNSWLDVCSTSTNTSSWMPSSAAALEAKKIRKGDKRRCASGPTANQLAYTLTQSDGAASGTTLSVPVEQALRICGADLRINWPTVIVERASAMRQREANVSIEAVSSYINRQGTCGTAPLCSSS